MKKNMWLCEILIGENRGSLLLQDVKYIACIYKYVPAKNVSLNDKGA